MSDPSSQGAQPAIGQPQPAPPPPDVAAAPECPSAFRSPEIGLEIRLSRDAWKPSPVFAGAAGLLSCPKMNATMLILWEHERVDAASQPRMESFQGLPKQTLDRFFPKYKPTRFFARQVAGQPAKVVTATCDEDCLILCILLPVHGWLAKILVTIGGHSGAEASRFFKQMLGTIHLLPAPAQWPELPEGFTPYDVRFGVPVGDWNAANADGRLAVCDGGQYQGILDPSEVRNRLAAGEVNSGSLVLAKAPSGAGRRWMSLQEATRYLPELQPASPITEAAQKAAAIAAIASLALGVPYGIYDACVSVSGSESLSHAMEGAVLLAASVVVGVPLGLFGFRVALNMLARDPMQGMMALLFCLVCVTSPIWVLGMAGESLLAAGWYLTKWLFWILWITLLFLLACCGIGAGIGALVACFRHHQNPGTVPPPTPSAAPPGHQGLWAPS